MSTNWILSQLKHQARGVADATDANAAAAADKKTVSVELLDAVVEAVRPALRALASRIVIARAVSGAGTTEKTLDEPGLFLASTGPAPATPGKADLFLCREGSFVLLGYDEAVDVGGVRQWKAAVVELATRDVVDMFPLAVVLDSIARALVEQAKSNTTKRTQEMVNQAARLRALVTLVRSI
jgi:hypothetical protein